MNKRKITKKKYRAFLNWFIHYLRLLNRIYGKATGVKNPFVFTNNGRRF